MSQVNFFSICWSEAQMKKFNPRDFEAVVLQFEFYQLVFMGGFKKICNSSNCPVFL